jgi:2-keto-4-pentenoate hydratase/2-oxohepta-3-ene-1,7-dioic acid hydratase in catechol pathway
MREFIVNKKIIISATSISVLFLALFSVLIFLYLDRGLEQEIQPASFTCLKPDQGYFSQQNIEYNNIYGIGLAYAKHINETASDFDADLDPPVFRKQTSSTKKSNSSVTIPTHNELLMAVESLEPGIGAILEDKEITLLPLLDYEAELAFVLLESITAKELEDPSFIPKVGFLVVNDLSARSIAILGEDQANRYDYWGVSKSYSGFSPVSDRLWVPNIHLANAIPCITLQTYVDGKLRQNENSRNLIYTPVDMLRFIHKKYPAGAMSKGDIILTGTPSGVVLNIPRWKARLAKIIGLDRFQKLAINQKESSAEKFLKAGNTVDISGEWLGDVSVIFVEP